MKEETNNYLFTEDQQKLVAEYYGYNADDLEFYQVCELLDKFIDEKITEELFGIKV